MRSHATVLRAGAWGPVLSTVCSNPFPQNPSGEVFTLPTTHKQANTVG